MATSLWKHRNFMLLWSGQLVSWFGTEFSGIALPLIVLSLTGSPALAGSIAAMRGFLYVFLALPAGALVDRWDRRTVMIVANLGSGIAMGSIALSLWLKVLTIPQLYITGAIEGVCFMFANISRMTTLPLIVKNEQLADASSKIGIADFSALALGPAIGGILYQTLGAIFSFFADSLSYFINAFSIFFINVSLKVEKETSVETKLHKEIQEGLVWFIKQPVIRFLTVIISGITIVSIGNYLLVIVLAKHFRASASVIGIILGVGATGGIIGSIIAPWFQKHFQFHKVIISSIVLLTLIFGLYFFVSNVVMIGVIIGFMSLVGPVYDITTYSYTATIIPNEIRGRINSITRMNVMACYSLGYFCMGLALQYLGITKTIFTFFSLLVILSLLVISNKAIRLNRLS